MGNSLRLSTEQWGILAQNDASLERNENETKNNEQDRVQRETRERDDEQDRARDQGEDGEQSTECIDEFSSFIKREINNLTTFMTNPFGLLEVLASNNVLTPQQVSIIQDGQSPLDKARKLLEEITRKTMSAEKKEAF